LGGGQSAPGRAFGDGHVFVLVVDTSLMNVSIAKVVEDLGTTVSGERSRSRRWL
jgi:hypothetical protein